MGSAWLGLLGAVIGGVVSLAGTLITSRLQWRQERARWNEQRERDFIQWSHQKESEIEKWESEHRRDTLAWKRDRDDEQFRWLRDQKLKYCMEVFDHLRVASELSSNLSYTQGGEQRRYAREDEMAIIQELRQSDVRMKPLSLVCGEDVAAELKKVSQELYFYIQQIDREGVKPGGMVRLPEERLMDEWMLNETIDGLSARISASMRTDLGSS